MTCGVCHGGGGGETVGAGGTLHAPTATYAHPSPLSAGAYAMKAQSHFAFAFIAGLMLSLPAAAQQDQSAAPAQPAAPAAPAAAAPPAPSVPLQEPGPTATAGSTPSPNLAVATVKLENGTRASKMIGAAVFNDQNQHVGSVDDVILNQDNKAVLAVISVGGFLGVGGKLVAVSYTQLHLDNAGKVVLPDASKEALNKMPSFVYAG